MTAAEPTPARRSIKPALLGLLAALASLLALAPAAEADITFGTVGSAAGQTNDPAGIAVDRSNGTIFVAERTNNRISVFEEDGDFLHAFGWGVDTGAAALEVCTTASGCQAGISGAAAGQLASPRFLTVDNDPASPSYHDLYVFDNANRRVQRFTPAGAFVLAFGDGVNQTTGGDVCTAVSGDTCKGGVAGFGAGQFGDVGFFSPSIAIGLGGIVFVADGQNNRPNPSFFRVQKFDSAGALTGQFPLPAPAAHIATDSVGDLYATNEAPGAPEGDRTVRRYDPAGGLQEVLDPLAVLAITNQSNLGPLAVDAADGIVSATSSGAVHFDSAGAVTRVLYGLTGASGLAAHSTPQGDLYRTVGGANSRIEHISYPPPGPVFPPEQPAASQVGNIRATLRAEINPEGEPTTYRFEHVTEAEFQANGFANAETTSEQPFVFSEAQRVTVSATAGQYRLSFGADTTEDLSLDTNQPQMQAALEALPSIGSGDVSVTGGRYTDGNLAGDLAVFTIVFAGDLAGEDVPQLVASDGTVPLSGGSATASVETIHLAGIPNFVAQEFSADLGCSTAGDPSCLIPETTYRFRAIATNAEAPAGVVGPTESFTTAPPLTFGESYSTAVGTKTATLHGELDPTGIPTSGHFEYVTEAEYQVNGFAGAQKIPDTDAAQLPLDFGAGTGFVEQLASLDGLAPDTAYRWRLVASNFFDSYQGPEGAFHTFPHTPATDANCPNQALRTGPGALLPDCRAYEMVSPIDKNNSNIEALLDTDSQSEKQTHYRTNPAGTRLTYASATAFGDARSAPYSSNYLASRDPAAGWSTHALDPPREANIIGSSAAYLHNHYLGFSEDLSTGWFFWTADPQPDPAAPPGYLNLYRANNLADTYTALNTVTPPTSPPDSVVVGARFAPRLMGFSADGSHAVFSANDRLAPGASTALDGAGRPIRQLYEYRDGAPLRLVSVLPGGGASPLPSSGGGGTTQLDNAVSTDGLVIYWTAGNVNDPDTNVANANLATGRVYARVAGTETVPVSQSVSGADAQFWIAAPDGSAALFSIVSGPLAGNLYRFDLAAETATLIATGVNGGAPGSVHTGVVGASPDLSRAYLSSTAILDPGPNSEGDLAIPGVANLYHWQQGDGFEYVATLGGGELGVTDHSGRHLKVSEDARHIAFTSREPLTGYDNTDPGSTQGGFKLVEVFRHSSLSGELDCLSCDPSGARTLGRDQWQGQSDLAALLPGWRQGAFHVQRFLSEDGDRVYFEAFFDLLPRDANGKVDVYQWQAAGSGDCTTQSDHYFQPNGGCLTMISSGGGEGDAEFVEATPDGETVFIRTDASLVPSDPGLHDIYAARIGGGIAAQHPPPAPAPCEGEECRGASPQAPQPLGAATAAFAGEGNPPPGRTCEGLGQKAKRKLRAAKRAAQKGQAKKARALRGQSGALSRKAKHCRRAAR